MKPLRLIPLPSKMFVREVSCGSVHTLILSYSGSVYAFGQNRDGQLGITYAVVDK